MLTANKGMVERLTSAMAADMGKLIIGQRFIVYESTLFHVKSWRYVKTTVLRFKY
jgi:hypothetical protein